MAKVAKIFVFANDFVFKMQGLKKCGLFVNIVKR